VALSGETWALIGVPARLVRTMTSADVRANAARTNKIDAVEIGIFRRMPLF
jgi:hypothetical protein